MAECKHAVIDWGVNYFAHYEYAERKIDQGEKQRRCPNCKLYVWESEWDKPALIDGDENIRWSHDEDCSDKPGGLHIDGSDDGR